MFWSKNIKKGIPLPTPVLLYIKVGYKGVFISRTCFLNAVAINFLLTSLDAGLLGFTVTNAFVVTGICQWAVTHSKKVKQK